MLCLCPIYKIQCVSRAAGVETTEGTERPFILTRLTQKINPVLGHCNSSQIRETEEESIAGLLTIPLLAALERDRSRGLCSYTLKCLVSETEVENLVLLLRKHIV